MKTRLISLLFCLLSPLAIATQSLLSDVVDNYLTTYQQRSDFEQFLSFYAEDVVLEDVIFGHLAENKTAFAAFFDWSLGDFQVLDNKPVMHIEHLIYDGNLVVIKGVFNPFQFQQKRHGPWRFITVLTFNEQQKIIKQEDWINYTPRSIIAGETNLNHR